MAGFVDFIISGGRFLFSIDLYSVIELVSKTKRGSGNGRRKNL